MTNKHGDFIWYELMTSDADASQDFYGGLVGWTFEDSGQPNADYRIFRKDGPNAGGLMPLSKEMQDGGARPLWAGYVGVEDADAAAKKIADLGGAVLMPPTDIPGVGRFAFVKDPQGVPLYVMRGASDAPSEAFAHSAPREGHCAWNELVTDDPAGAKKFYGDAFGWSVAEAMDMGPMGEYEMLKNGADRPFLFGAIMKKPDAAPMSSWNYYFRVADIDVAAAYVNAEGGEILNGPMEIPGGEYVFTGVDPQGAVFSLIGPRAS